MNSSSVEEWMASKVASTLNIDNQDVDRTMPFLGMGLDSLTFLTLTGDLAAWLGHDLPVQLLWECPTIESLARRLATSSPNAGDAAISPAPRDQPLPLSFSQERMWRYADPQGDNNIILQKWMVKGELDYEILERTLGELIRRHEILRTTFAFQDEQPVQIIHPPAPAPFKVIDLSDEQDPGEQAFELLCQEYSHLFNLEQGPLFHVTLLRLSPREHRIVFNLHHIVFDATTAGIFFKELSAIYSAYQRGEPCGELRELPVQVADFAIWQRSRLSRESEHYQKLMAWWKDYWSGPLMPGAPRLPFHWQNEQERPNSKESVVSWEIPQAFFEKIMGLSRKEGLSYFTIFFAAFGVVLYQLTGQEEAVIGSYISDRNRTEVKNLLGFFVNLLALRTNMRGQPTFREVLTRVHQMTYQVTAHQELPFDVLVDEFRRDSRNVPDVQLIFQFLSDPEVSFRLPGVEIQRWRAGTFARMPWGLIMSVIHRIDDTASVTIAFDAGLYDPVGVTCMMRLFEVAMENILTKPETRPVPCALADRVHHLEKQLQIEASQSADQFHQLQKQIEHLNLTLLAARRVSDNMRRSFSWRWTLPLRVIRDAAARTFRSLP